MQVSLQSIVPVVRRCGLLAVEIYNRGFDVQIKDDKSPVTEADLAVDNLLVPALMHQFPDIPVISEERVEDQKSFTDVERFFLVDPIDGTREFINKTGEFTINVALIENGDPIAGVVYAPVLGRLFVADLNGGAFELNDKDERRPIGVRRCASSELVALASRSHNTAQTQEFLDRHAIDNCVRAGSSLKFCILAAGEADIYPRFGPTMEWDTAAGQAILRAAGGLVLNIDQSELRYGKPMFKNPDFIACSPEANRRCGGKR